jgi:hypothetical protein
MPVERESHRTTLSGIRVDLKDRSVTFETENKPVAKIAIAPEGVVFEILRADAAPSVPPSIAREEAPAASRSEREKTVSLTGRLKSQPKEGKADSRGNPTAWARLAVHEEGREDAHLYLATFHRHTAPIALTLPREVQITVEGYPHPSSDPAGTRLDTLSVIKLVNYPGKPEKPKR